MSRGGKRGVQSDFLAADSVEDAILKLKALKQQRGAGVAVAAEHIPAELEPEVQAPAAIPKRRGRPPKASARAAEASPTTPEPPSFAVSKLTAHRPLGLLEVQDSTDLDALLADPRLAAQIALRLSDRFALVLPAQLERLQSALLKAGHTPRLSGTAGERP